MIGRKLPPMNDLIRFIGEAFLICAVLEVLSVTPSPAIKKPLGRTDDPQGQIDCQDTDAKNGYPRRCQQATLTQ